MRMMSSYRDTEIEYMWAVSHIIPILVSFKRTMTATLFDGDTDIENVQAA